MRDIRVIRVLTFDASLDDAAMESIRTEIFTNPVTEDSSYAPIARDFDWLIWIGFRPGVRDTAGSTAKEAMEDLLGFRSKRKRPSTLPSSMKYRGCSPGRKCAELPPNSWPMMLFSNGGYFPERTGITNRNRIPMPKVILNHEPWVSTIPIGSDDELKRISLERNLALQDSDIPIIRDYFLREDIRPKEKRWGLIFPRMWNWSIFPKPEAITATTTPSGAFSLS